ncbi:FliG C-terminal domain-containing protein [Tabrizicola sp.]|uniref:flagellar motor switch protein FliG n=1 Tax=Tabrizicola sp. TaxID=2005166 RepID=UPI00262D32E4|nr:FliG C-terminal domain-containing protein [Tabrizicola sp.]MDM7930426.1 FliG C-terminal domain-containing protein [Tabrizicola sp.]
MPQDLIPFARITPERRSVAVPSGVGLRPVLTSRQKAAVIVRYLLTEGATIPLATLPEHMQAALAEQMGKMRLIDRTTLDEVVAEFLAELESVGLSFPGGIEGALSMMDGHISQSAASRLRRMASASSKVDPWERITALPVDRLLPILADEAVEVGAVMLSKLPVAKAAEILGRLPGERARRVAYAVSMTGKVDPETVRRIGAALLAELDNQPPRAFDTGPVERVGAILNISPALTREDVLQGLEAEDADFAAEVRRAIFTFIHIPARLNPRDAPKITRLVEQPLLVTALAAAQGKPGLEEAAEFLLANISQRLAEGLREEMATRGKIKDKDGEEAMTAIISAIRSLEASSEITLIQPEDD